jgi:hypothetical protein
MNRSRTMQFTALWRRTVLMSQEQSLAKLLDAPDGATLEECRRIADEMRAGVDDSFDWEDSSDQEIEEEGNPDLIGVIEGDVIGLTAIGDED